MTSQLGIIYLTCYHYLSLTVPHTSAPDEPYCGVEYEQQAVGAVDPLTYSTACCLCCSACCMLWGLQQERYTWLVDQNGTKQVPGSCSDAGMLLFELGERKLVAGLCNCWIQQKPYV